jgi:MATE family multidrug resistance protein
MPPTPLNRAPLVRPSRREASILFGLSAPVVVAQVGMMAMSVIDMLMIARIGVPELAAVAIASTFAWAWGSLGQGIVHGMDPMVSQAHGAGDGEGAALALQRGLVIAAIVAVPIGAIWLATGHALIWLGQDPDVARLAQTYMTARVPGIVGFQIYVALRQYLAGRTLTRPAMWVMFLANALNILLNWVLIFGHLGSPPLGLLGAGIATGVTNLMLPILLAAWIRFFGLHRGAWRRWDRKAFDAAGLARYMRLGIPIGIQMWLEGNAFTVAMLMVGWVSVVDLAAYQVVLNVASLTFMVPLGISIGAATRVGNLIGAGRSEEIAGAATTAFAMGGGVMALFGVGMVLFREIIPRFYLQDPAVVGLAALLLPIGGVFQIADGLQVVGGGLMRGMGRPRAAAFANLLGYYVLGLPLGWLLSFRFGMGTAGVLWGMAAGLGLVATLLVGWTLRTSKRPLSELRVVTD